MGKKSIQTTWNLTHLYKNLKEVDTHIEKIDKAFTAFAKKYQRATRYVDSVPALKKALDDQEKPWDVVASKPYVYLSLATDVNGTDEKLQAKLNKVQERMSHITNKVVFFEIALGKVSKQKQKMFLKDSRLKKYHYFLKNVFEKGKYLLSESEEKILTIKNLTSYSLWRRGFEKALYQKEVVFKKKKLPISKATETLSSNITLQERRTLWAEITTQLKTVADFAESELNAVIIDKKLDDELRGYKHPYSATVQDYENTEHEVLTLVDTVTSQFRIAHKYYRLKQKALGIKKFTYIDRFAQPERLQKYFSFEVVQKLFMESLDEMGGPYRGIFEKFLQNGQIDVFPKKGKRGGAYCSGGVNRPTYVLLNHTDTINSATTLAHEMGHAFHRELSKQQEPLYEGYTTSVAEVASTFFENILFEKLLATLTPDEQRAALFEKLDGTVATIFRQNAFFNFELDLHGAIRKKGSLSHKDIALLLKKHLHTYMGNHCEVTLDDGYSFVYIPHFRYAFYVYSYVYGELISSALYHRYKEDASYLKEIEKFLSAGGSKSPYDIFKDIGVDTKDPTFWKSGLKEVERAVNRLDSLL